MITADFCFMPLLSKGNQNYDLILWIRLDAQIGTNFNYKPEARPKKAKREWRSKGCVANALIECGFFLLIKIIVACAEVALGIRDIRTWRRSKLTEKSS